MSFHECDPEILKGNLYDPTTSIILSQLDFVGTPWKIMRFVGSKKFCRALATATIRNDLPISKNSRSWRIFCSTVKCTSVCPMYPIRQSRVKGEIRLDRARILEQVLLKHRRTTESPLFRSSFFIVFETPGGYSYCRVWGYFGYWLEVCTEIADFKSSQRTTCRVNTWKEY